MCGPVSVVSIANGYWLDGLGNEYRWGEIFRNCPDWPWGPHSILYIGYRVFSGGKERPGHNVELSPPSSAVVMNGWSCTSTKLMGCTACTEPQCLYKGALFTLPSYVCTSQLVFTVQQ